MTSLAPEVTLALSAIAGLTALAILGTLAHLVRNATAMHDLQVSAATLRINYARQLAASDDQEVIEVDEAPALPEPPDGPSV
jgi:hypothetical protein